MTIMVRANEVRSLLEHKGAAKTVQHFKEALEQRALRPDNFSIAELAIGCNGQEWFDNLRSQKGGFQNLTEAANAVSTAAFAGITGQLVFNRVNDAYTNPKFIWTELFESFQTVFLNGERIPGVGTTGDQFSTPIGEGEPYPNIGISEEFVDTPALQKRGGIVPVTREIIIADRTGLLLERCDSAGDGLGVNTERRALDVVTGQTNNYRRNTVSSNTYASSGNYINSQTNAMVDHTDLENAELLMSAITDPNTGLFMTQEISHLVVPLELKKTALRIINTTEVAVVDNSATTNTQRQFSDAPKTLYDKRFSTLKVLSNQYVKERSSQAGYWYPVTRSKKPFGRTYAWEMKTQTAGETSELAFTNDIMYRHKVDVMDALWVWNPRYTSVQRG